MLQLKPVLSFNKTSQKYILWLSISTKLQNTTAVARHFFLNLNDLQLEMQFFLNESFINTSKCSRLWKSIIYYAVPSDIFQDNCHKHEALEKNLLQVHLIVCRKLLTCSDTEFNSLISKFFVHVRILNKKSKGSTFINA